MMDKYAVVGNPIQHSLSPTIHKMFSEQTRQNISYEKICIDIDKFKESILKLKKEGYKGLNITVPFKQEAFALSEVLSDRAQKAKAVNTFIFKEDSKIYGDNTDGAGLIRDITNNKQYSIKNKTILIIGAGGAARGIIQPFLNSEPKSITVTNRTISKAVELANEFNDKILVRSFSELNEQYDCIINATSMGLSDTNFPLEGKLIKSDSLCYDMVYGKETSFMHWAKINNAAIVSDGLGMLVEQAAESFFLWRGVYPDTNYVLNALKKS